MSETVAADIAVIIVNYNAGGVLTQSLAALYGLEDGQPGEIIVVDNASDDESLSQAKEVYPDVSYIELASNTGFAVANNKAVERATKPWVALINPDAFVKPSWMKHMLIAINKQNSQFFSSELIDANDYSRIDGQGDCYHVSGLVWRRKHGQKVSGGVSKLPMFAPCAASAVYKKESFLAVGGFDERYFCYIEDIDLGFRLRLAGYDCEHVSDAVTYHIGSAITQRESDFSVYHGHRNIVWTYFKNMPSKLVWRYLPQHLFMNLVSLTYYTLKGRPRIIFRAKWHALKGLSKIWASRSDLNNNALDDQDISKHMTKGWLTPYIGRNG